MPDDLRTLLATTAFRAADVESLLDPKGRAWVKFDPELGYVQRDILLRDGVDNSLSTYSYEPTGQRKMINWAGQPCRINTYGDSYTQCQQVSDDETWQERLAAHLGEPIRNFGCAGYGVYQSYRRALRMESSDCAAEYVILNIFHDDHVRSLDSSRWIRSAWNERNRPPEQPYLLHGLPWSHVRYDLRKASFAERPGLCATEDDLRALSNPDRFYEAFKDDTIVRLFVLEIGGEVDVSESEALAEALGVGVNLRDPARRREDALRLHVAYGLKATEYILDKMRTWIEARGKKLMILLSYGRSRLAELLRGEGKDRFDRTFLEYLDRNGFLYVDGLRKHLEDFRKYNLSYEDYTDRYYVRAAGAAVFGHYNPLGNLFFAFSIKDELVSWLNPKPSAYR